MKPQGQMQFARDAVLGHLQRDRVGELDDGRFGSGVRVWRVAGDEPGHARGGDDAAAPLAPDQGRGVLHAEKNAAHQYVKGDVPLFDRRFGDGAEGTAEPRIVENAVEPAERRLGA